MTKYTEKWTPAERKAMRETQHYTYTNSLIKNMTLLGHKVCKDLREYGDCTVVDLGCGTGDHFPYIQSKDIIGVDVNDDRLSIARTKFPYVDVRKESIFNLSFKDNSISSIVSIGTLEHLTPLEKALQEINRIMSPSGEFIFSIPTEGFLYRLGRNLTIKPYVEKMTGVNYNKLLKKEHINRCSDILKELKKVFVVDKLVGIPFKLPVITINIFIAGRCTKK